MALTDNLISYYKYEGNSNDSVGSNNGTDTSITYGSSYGKINQGALFNGSSSKIISTPTIPTNTLTIAAWVNWDGTLSTNWRSMVIAGNLTGSAMGLFISSGNFWTVSGSTGATDLISSTTATTGWHFIVGNLSFGQFTLWLDGTQIATGSKNPGTISNNLTVGTGINPDWFPGDIDEVGVWGRNLSSAEITQLYNGGVGLTWPFTTTTSTNSGFFMNFL